MSEFQILQVSAIGALTILKNLILSSGTFSEGWQTLTIGGNVSGTGANFSAGTGQVILNGSSLQSISGVTFNDLIINNTGGGVTLVSHGNSTVSDSLTLTSGILTTDASDLLILSSTTPVTGASNSSFIDGPVENNALSGTNTSFLFPTGNNSKYAPVALSSVTATSTYTAQYFKSPHTASTSGISGTAPTASTKEYWTLTENSGSADADVTLYWNDGTFSGITSVSDITMYVDDPGNWIDLSGTPTGTASTGSVTAPVTSTILAATPAFFTFGDNSGANPLPVSLVSFAAQYQDNHVNLNWTTASEQNNAYFEIQCSTDGASWMAIGQVQGHGTSDVYNSYLAVDNLTGVIPSGTIYYRLKQVDFNGEFAYSMIRSVNLSNPGPAITAYPNPTNSTLNVNWVSSSDDNAVVKMVNMNGETVYQQTLSGKGMMTKQIDVSTLSDGIYYLQIISGNNNLVHQAIYKN